MLGISPADSAAYFAEVALGLGALERGGLQRKWQLDGNVLRFDKSNRSLEYKHPRCCCCCCCMNEQAAVTEAGSSDTGVRIRYGENRMNECNSIQSKLREYGFPLLGARLKCLEHVLGTSNSMISPWYLQEQAITLV